MARDLLADAGYGEAFGHSLGHGVGMLIHEAPRMSHLSNDILESGMVLSVEPGIYLPGWGGVRIEDMGGVREDGIEVLTGAAKVPVIQVDGRRQTGEYVEGRLGG